MTEIFRLTAIRPLRRLLFRGCSHIGVPFHAYPEFCWISFFGVLFFAVRLRYEPGRLFSSLPQR